VSDVMPMVISKPPQCSFSRRERFYVCRSLPMSNLSYNNVNWSFAMQLGPERVPLKSKKNDALFKFERFPPIW
jgi:hypothetical protein